MNKLPPVHCAITGWDQALLPNSSVIYRKVKDLAVLSPQVTRSQDWLNRIANTFTSKTLQLICAFGFLL